MTLSPLRNLEQRGKTSQQSSHVRGQGGAGCDAHLANEAIFVDGASLFAVGQPRRLRPHLLDVLENHVAVAVKGLDAGEQLAVVADGDEHLDVRAHGGLEDGEGPGGEFVLLELRDFVFPIDTRRLVLNSSLLRLLAWGVWWWWFSRT